MAPTRQQGAPSLDANPNVETNSPPVDLAQTNLVNEVRETPGSNTWRDIAKASNDLGNAAAKVTSTVHFYDVYPQHRGEELRISEQGDHTKAYLAELEQARAHSPYLSTDLSVANFTALRAITKEFGYYDLYKQDEKKALASEKKKLTELLNDDTKDPGMRLAAVNAWLEKNKYALKDPDKMPKNSLDCQQQAALLKLGLSKLGFTNLELHTGEYYARGETVPSLVPSSSTPTHMYVYVPPAAGESFGSILESTEANPNEANRKITGTTTAGGREFWVTEGGFLYRKAANVPERVETIGAKSK